MLNVTIENPEVGLSQGVWVGFGMPYRTTDATQSANPDPLSVSGSVNFVNLGDFIDTLTGDVSWNYNPNIFGFADIEGIDSDGSFTLTYHFTPTSTPEPTTTLGLIGLGMMGLSRLRKKTK
ncbi:MAG: PEP-CTERM sorting domain-containing protein [Crocosphaera sp.]